MAQDEDKQMVLAFMTEAEDVDPVSGNEVPPGSLPEEVRDDIPARLSEGEYVVPADVLRFYGVKFFEDLRENAKRELARMDREGRIGGEPIPNEELSDEEKAELDSIGAAVGGFITGQPTQSTMPDPYQQQQMMYRQGAPVAMGNAGYQEGGLEDGSEPTYTDEQLRNAFAPGFSFLDTPSLQPADAQFTPVMMYKQGENPTMALTKQQYDIMLSEGWSTEQVQITTETDVGQPNNDDPEPPKVEQEKIALEDMDIDQLTSTIKGLGTMNSIATAIASTVGIPVTALINAGTVAQYNDAIDLLEDKGVTDHGFEKKGSIFGGEATLFEGLEDSDGSGGASFGDTWLGDLLGFDGKAGVQGDGLRDSFGGSRRDGDTNKGGGSGSSKSSSNIVKDPDPDKYESDDVTRDAFEDISPSTPPAMTNPSSGAQ